MAVSGFAVYPLKRATCNLNSRAPSALCCHRHGGRSSRYELLLLANRERVAVLIILLWMNSGILHPLSSGFAIPSQDAASYAPTQTTFCWRRCTRDIRKKKKQNNFKCKRNKKLFQTPCTITKVPGKMPTQPSLLSLRQRECEKPAEIWCPWGEPRSQEC